MQVPETFRAMPRWWQDADGRDWLDRLPELVAQRCREWGLTTDGKPWHGSNALVVPVRRGSQSLALRMSPPGDDLRTEIAALTWWDGRGTVRLVDATDDAMVLERLDGSRTLADLPLDEAVPVLAMIMRRLAVPAPDWASSTAVVAAAEAARFAADWERLGRPCPGEALTVATDAARRLGARTVEPVAADGDLHYEQVLAGEREPWLVVDPVLLRGDIEYDLGRVLWSRLDEMTTDDDVRAHFATVVRIAELDQDRARDWVLTRALSYLLWGLDHGLTEDPVRCGRLLSVFG